MKTKEKNTHTKTIEWWDKTHNESAMLSRWICLYEAVNLIANIAEEKGVNPEEIVYKPKAIRDYISATENIILKKILEEDYKIEICYSEEPSKENFETKFY
jgi:hypothetical protein